MGDLILFVNAFFAYLGWVWADQYYEEGRYFIWFLMLFSSALNTASIAASIF